MSRMLDSLVAIAKNMEEKNLLGQVLDLANEVGWWYLKQTRRTRMAISIRKRTSSSSVSDSSIGKNGSSGMTGISYCSSSYWSATH
jgi:hypothetical protein